MTLISVRKQNTYERYLYVKGRVLAVFRILRISSGFLIFVNKSVAEKFKTHLEKYAVFFKTKIEFIDKAIDGIEIISESDFEAQLH